VGVEKLDTLGAHELAGAGVEEPGAMLVKTLVWVEGVISSFAEPRPCKIEAAEVFELLEVSSEATGIERIWIEITEVEPLEAAFAGLTIGPTFEITAEAARVKATRIEAAWVETARISGTTRGAWVSGISGTTGGAWVSGIAGTTGAAWISRTIGAA
jgi:hypothetical protein